MRSKFDTTASFFPTIVFLLLGLLHCVSADAQCNVAQIHKLLAEDGAAGDHFGRDVAISGNTAIIGAPHYDDNGQYTGSAYFFDTKTGQQTHKLLPDAAGISWGGLPVAISGNIAIVGASWDDGIADSSGSAYLYDTTTGQQIAKLLPDAGVSAVGAAFGTSVAISGSTAIVGAPYEDTTIAVESGSAYLFDATTGQKIDKLLASDGRFGDDFGWSVGISWTTAIVGAPALFEDRPGAAYLFDTTTGQQLAKLLATDGVAGDQFGSSCAIDGTTAIVGAWSDDDNGPNSGSAYVFDATTGQQVIKLLPDDGAAGDGFGASIAISGTTAIVSARGDDDNAPNSGAAYLFDTTTWQQIAKIRPNDGALHDGFGSVALSGTTAIVGADGDDDNGMNSGSAYVFDVSILTSCPVHFEYPNRRPILVDSVGGTTMRVVAVNGGGQPQPNTGVLHVNRGNGFETFPMTQLSDNVYDAVFPPSNCGTILGYYVSAENTSGELFTDPEDAPTAFYTTLSVGDQGTIVFTDDFEADLGWTVSGDATDGHWDRGIPADDGSAGDPLTDADGSGSCYLTDNAAGNSDVDNGSTILTSPIFDATGSGGEDAVISYYRSYANCFSFSYQVDVFIVEISNNGGATWTNLETVGPTGPETYGGWIFKIFHVNDFIQPTDQMRVRFIASDTDPQRTVEAGVDGVQVRLITCDAVDVVHANQYTVYRGLQIGGDLSDSFDSDDSYLKFNPGFVINSAEAPVWLIFDGTLPSDSPASLEILMESTAGTPGLTHTLEAWNWTSAAYDVIDVSAASFNNDVVVTVNLSSQISDYAQAGTGAVRTRLGWRKTGLVINFPWEVRLDQLVWTLTKH